MVTSRKPSQLSAQPGEHAPRAIHYPTDVQPVLDRNCVSCHSGKKPKGKINLSGELTVHFNRSYETLIDGNWVSYLQEFLGPQKGGGAMSYAGVIKPKSIGSHASRLIKHLDAGHNKVQLSAGDRLKLVTWIDSNAPYYGSYFGRRNIQWRKHPDFRPVPTVDSARGIEQGLKK